MSADNRQDLVQSLVDGRISRRDFVKRALAAGISVGAVNSMLRASEVSASSAVAAAQSSTPTTASSGEAVQIDLWTEFTAAPAGPAMNAIVDAFNKAHPNIRVKHTAFENTPYKAALKAAFAAGDVPDVAEDDTGGWLSPYVDADQLVDITDLVDQYKDNFDPGTIDAITYKDRKWAVPFGVSPGNLIWYNKDILAKNGIDPSTLTTWSAFTAALDKVKQAGVTPMILGNKEGWPGAHWLGNLYVRTMGVAKADELFNRALTPGFTTPLKFTDPMAVKPWQMLKDMQDKGYFSKGILSDDFPTAYAKFFRGDGAFFQTGGWLLATQQDEAPDFHMGSMLFPAIDGISESDATDFVFNVIGMRIPKAAKHQEQAREFITWWLTSPEPHTIWSQQNVGTLPAVKNIESLQGVPPEVNEFLKLKNNAHHSTLFIDSKLDGDVSQDILWQASNGLFSGALSPDSAAQNAEQRVSDWQAKHAT
jgi:raffinose/stachyose/melibiose transport system substrate-binding protein